MVADPAPYAASAESLVERVFGAVERLQSQVLDVLDHRIRPVESTLQSKRSSPSSAPDCSSCWPNIATSWSGWA